MTKFKRKKNFYFSNIIKILINEEKTYSVCCWMHGKKKFNHFIIIQKKFKFTNVEFPHIPQNTKIHKYNRI